MSSARLNIKEILDNDPSLRTLADGAQVHVNHYGCPAGRDTKRRLYVKNDRGSLVMYCHHCGAGGKVTGQRCHIRRNTGNYHVPDVTLPQDLIISPEHCNVHFNVWINKSGLSLPERELYQFGWSGWEGRGILPIRWYHNGQATGVLEGYQRRRVLPHDTMPKYLTTKRLGIRNPVFAVTHDSTPGVAVLVEDILSAAKVGRQADAYALLGTSLSEYLKYRLAGKYKHALVWLDNDNPSVRSAQRDIAKALGIFIERVTIIHHDKDPKLCTDQEIENVVRSSILSSARSA